MFSLNWLMMMFELVDDDVDGLLVEVWFDMKQAV